MPDHRTGTREEWLAERSTLAEREQELGKLREELTNERRELPWVRVDKEYTLDTEAGPKTLAELFDGRSQLLVYHFMFGPDWTGGCPGCTFLVDQLEGSHVHLEQHGITVACLAHAPIEKLREYKQRMGWTIPFASSYESDFNRDYGVSFSEEELAAGTAEYNFRQLDVAEVLESFKGDDSIAEAAESVGTDVEGYVTREGPGLSAFALEDGVVYHTYSAFGPDFGGLSLVYSQLAERAPTGADSSIPIRRRDEYETAVAAGS